MEVKDVMEIGNLAECLGSLLAIGCVWWQLDYDKKCKYRQELADKQAMKEQHLRSYQGHLQNVRTRLMTFNNRIIGNYKNHQKFSNSEVIFLMDSIKNINKSIEISMQEISHLKKMQKFLINQIGLILSTRIKF